jgi:hypothetical protein
MGIAMKKGVRRSNNMDRNGKKPEKIYNKSQGARSLHLMTSMWA